LCLIESLDKMEKFFAYQKDSREPCKYGRKCFQTNKEHTDKYKHPPTKVRHLKLIYFILSIYSVLYVCRMILKRTIKKRQEKETQKEK
jgi:hypothetical protein